MAWQVSKRVWDSVKTKGDKKKGIDASERLMLLALADKADEDGICWPKYDTSYQTLGDLVGVNRRSAMRLADNLAKVGHIWKSETAGRGHSNIFIVTIGLSGDEVKDRLALIGVTDDTITNEGKVLPEAPINEPEKEMVLPVTQNGVMDDTNKGLNGVTGNTQSILKNPSNPTEELPKGNGGSPQLPLVENPETEPTPEEPIPEETLLPDSPELLLLFEKINHNRKLRNWTPVKSFKSSEQKQKCQAAAIRLGFKRFKTGITKGLEKGLTDLASLVNWIDKWEKGANSGQHNQSGNTQSQSTLAGDPGQESSREGPPETDRISPERLAALERLTFT